MEIRPKGRAALDRLMDGNARFAASRAESPNRTGQRRAEIVAGQAPFAAVCCCSDSRVPPEILSDQGLGDLFVVRVAGNVLSDPVIGSLEYAAEHLEVPLILVLGHERCGAVKAAMGSGAVEGHIGCIIDEIRPVLDAARETPGDTWDNASRLNAKRIAETLRRTPPVLSERVKIGTLDIVPAYYGLTTGKIELL